MAVRTHRERFRRWKTVSSSLSPTIIHIQTVSCSRRERCTQNFVNTIGYALADLLSGQDEVLVDKGMPPAKSLRKSTA
jgi:hypothetical protein